MLYEFYMVLHIKNKDKKMQTLKGERKKDYEQLKNPHLIRKDVFLEH